MEGGRWKEEVEGGVCGGRWSVEWKVECVVEGEGSRMGTAMEWKPLCTAWFGLQCSAQGPSQHWGQSAWTKRQPGPARKFNPGMPGPYALQEALEEANGASMPPAPKSGLGLGKVVTHVQ